MQKAALNVSHFLLALEDLNSYLHLLKSNTCAITLGTVLLPTFLEGCSLTLGEISHMPAILRAALARKDHFRS